MNKYVIVLYIILAVWTIFGFYNFIVLLVHFKEGKTQQIFTHAWIFNSDLLDEEGKKARKRLLIGGVLFIATVFPLFEYVNR